jgi:virginiamycin A acetyltransferase
MSKLKRLLRIITHYFRAPFSGYKLRLSRVYCTSPVGAGSLIRRSVVLSDVVVGRSCKLHDSVLVGEICIDDFVEIHNSRLSGHVSVGRFTVINPKTSVLSSVHEISIGQFCSIAPEVWIQEYLHRTDYVTTYYINKHLLGGSTKDDITSKGPIVIGNDVWIGTKSTILSGLRIGDGAIIGANSLVTKDIPPYAVVGGSPARVIKYRFTQETIELLLRVKWWDWKSDYIREHGKLFSLSDERQIQDYLRGLIVQSATT